MSRAAITRWYYTKTEECILNWRKIKEFPFWLCITVIWKLYYFWKLKSACRIRSIRCRGYYLFHSSILCGFYSRVAFISLSQSLCWCRRARSSIEWLLDRQENLLVVADWFTSLFWVCFVSSRRVFACARATHVFVTPTAATIWERRLLCSAQVEVRLLFGSGY